MIRGRNIEAEIDIPQTLEVPSKGGKLEVPARISLHNTGEGDFVAHARSADDRHFWHVFDEHRQEVLREKGRGKGGATGVKVRRGVHTFETQTVSAGQSVHHEHTLRLNSRKLAHGSTYTVRGELYGHPAEATFVVVKEPATKKPKKKAKKKAAPAKKKATAAKTGKARKRPARKVKKKVVRASKKR